MIYDTLNQSPTGLRTIGLTVGAWLVISHGYALWKSGQTQAWLQKLPFNSRFGQITIGFAAFWAFFLFKGLHIGPVEIPRMDMGEFFNIRPFIMAAIPLTAFLVILYCDEFLAARALGTLLLLAAAVPLDAAFQREPTSRLLLVFLAYAAIVKGLFWIGMPYLLRDQIKWASASAARWKALCLGGLAYGVAILAFALTSW